MNRKIVFIFVLICIIVFLIFNYIFLNIGNNISRNEDEIVEYIYNLSSNYEADIDVLVKSNKNENTYNMLQRVEDKNSKLVVNKPDNIKDLTIELNENTLKITNAKLNMEKIYNGYESIINNSLFLNTFINDFKNNNGKILKNDEEIILEVSLKNSSNTYINFKELHINKEKMMPTELIIKGNIENISISIKYNDIKIK